MKRSVLIVIVCVAVCVAGFAVWKLSARAVPQPKQVVAQPLPKTVPPPAPPAQPEPKVETPVATAAPTPPAAPAPTAAPEQPKILTAETLKGTQWKDGIVDFVFLPDGRWQMNGRICAKWAVEGGKVRVYSDSGEEHIFEIRGESLAYNGNKIGRRN